MIRPIIRAGVGLVLVACAAPGPGVAKEPKTPSAAKTPVQAVEQPAPEADELYTLLRTYDQKGGVLAALPDDVRTSIEQRIEAFSAEQKRALLDPKQPFAYERPLLHLVAGGETLGAYTSLFATSAAADELVEARYQSGQFSDLPAVVTSVAEAAASHVLKARTASVAPGVERKKEVLGEIAAAAEFLEEEALYMASLDALMREFPDPRWAFMRAGTLARKLQPDAAQAALPKEGDVNADHARAADQLIAAARTASTAATSPDEAVAVARAFLLLDRDESARQALLPFAEMRASHLGVATGDLRAKAGSGPCPELRTPLGNAPLCRALWEKFLTEERLQLLQDAWQSGTGRDTHAVDTLLGLSHVVPLMYGLAEDESKAVGHLSSLEQGAQTAVEVSPRYQGVALLASALRTAFSASVAAAPGRAPDIPKAKRTKLLQRGQAALAAAPDTSWNQAAALAVAAVLAPQEDSTALLAEMNETVRAEWRITHASLLVWNYLADRAAESFTKNKGLLGRAAETSVEGSYERSRWVILWAEADAHLQPSEQSYSVVQELAERLKAPQVPLGLRLRMALDVAGIKARQGDFTTGAGLLEPLVTSTPRGAVQTRHEQELLVAATGYLSVLRALTTEGQPQAEHIQALDELLSNVAQASAAPPVLMMWLALWKGELDAMAAKQSCGGNAPCERKADALRGIRKNVFEQVVGPRMAGMLRNGVLPIGGVDLEFRYRGGQLVPQVAIDPAFLLVHMPTLDAAPR